MRLSTFGLGLAVIAGLASVAGAQTGVQAYNGTGATTGGAGGNLNIGHEFTVTGTGITVQQLGVFDNGSDGLVSSHDVTLFSIGSTGSNPTNTPLATVNVPAGTTAPITNGFRFEPITPTYLAPGNYAVIAYGLNSTGGDPYGDGGGLPDGTNNVSDVRFDPYQFTSAGTPAFPNSGDGNIHAASSIIYDVGNTTVPEPASLGMLTIGAAGLLARRRK